MCVLIWARVSQTLGYFKIKQDNCLRDHKLLNVSYQNKTNTMAYLIWPHKYHKHSGI